MSTLDPAISDAPTDEELAEALARAVGIDRETALEVIHALHGAGPDGGWQWEDSFTRQLRHRLTQATLKR